MKSRPSRSCHITQANPSPSRGSGCPLLFHLLENMAERFFFNVADKVLGKLSSIIAQEVSLGWGVESELGKLNSTISAIRAGLLDAEEKQAHDHQLTDWLGKLKDALYDAEDVLDEFQYEALRSQVVKPGGIRRKVCKFFSSSHSITFGLKIGHRIKEVSDKLDEIAAQKAKFHLTEQYVDRRVMHRDREREMTLLKIGDQIVKKCKGVPLAVRTLGSLLYSKMEERDWLFIRDNEIWKFEQKENYILPALRLSYDQMPFYLKQCLVYCSIFPKDFEFNNYTLTQFWMAQGLLQSSNENENWEDIGYRYIIEFWSRSFLQDFEDRNTYLIFKMHDLVHDLTLLMAQSECVTINFETHNISRRVRHVSFSGDGIPWKEVPRFLVEENNLRTIFFPTQGVVPTKSFEETCISRFRYLRVLDLRATSLEALPSSIGNMKHLRYLDISGNCSIKNIPNSICKLHNLQTLLLTGCSEFEELPRDIGNLIGLRYLGITTKQVFLQKDGIESLVSLQTLKISECVNLKSLGEWMQRLTFLRPLLIDGCESLEESLLCSIKYLTNLETLAIENCGKINLVECNEDILGLKFIFRSFFIVRLPQLLALPPWLQVAANTLHCIFIGHCQNLEAMPEWLQNLTMLQTIEIEDCPRLLILPEAMRHLTRLRHLEMRDCPDLSRRCQRERGEEWLKIAHIAEITIDGEKINSIYD